VVDQAGYFDCFVLGQATWGA